MSLVDVAIVVAAAFFAGGFLAEVVAFALSIWPESSRDDNAEAKP